MENAQLPHQVLRQGPALASPKQQVHYDGKVQGAFEGKGDIRVSEKVTAQGYEGSGSFGNPYKMKNYMIVLLTTSRSNYSGREYKIYI